MVKRMAVLVLVAFLLVIRAVAADPLEGYPLKIEVVEPPGTDHADHADHVNTADHANHANVDDGQAVYAIDFKYVCDVKVSRLPEGQHYPAKWVEPRMKLRVRVEIGLRGDFKECDIETTVRDGVYAIRDGRLSLVSPDEIEQLRAAARSVEREVADRSDYPLTLFVLNGNASEAPPRILGLPTGSFKGFGQGDIFEPRSARGVDFQYECVGVLVPGRRYPARWLEPQERLEVLIPAANRPNRYYPCEATTEVKPELYVLGKHP
jgi:hypothetical protein